MPSSFATKIRVKNSAMPLCFIRGWKLDAFFVHSKLKCGRHLNHGKDFAINVYRNETIKDLMCWHDTFLILENRHSRTFIEAAQEEQSHFSTFMKQWKLLNVRGNKKNCDFFSQFWEGKRFLKQNKQNDKLC